MTKILVEKTVIEQALEALETSRGQWVHSVNAALCFKAIDTLEEALDEQAEQEPVVKIHKYNEFQTLGSLNLPIGTKLYAAPVRTKDLTDDEISKIWDDSSYGDSGIDFARAVIAVDRVKNNV